MAKTMRAMGWGTLLLAAAGAAGAADKAELFKCVDAAGATSIQSTACAKGSTQVWRRDATPEARPTAEQEALALEKRERDQRTVRELSAEVERKLKPPPKEEPAAAKEKATAEDAPPDRCAQAQDFARQVRENAWLGLSDEQVRRVYSWVATQCEPAARTD